MNQEIAPAGPVSRIASIDLIRGAVMVLMAIDHVGVFACRWFADLKARRSDWWLGYL